VIVDPYREKNPGIHLVNGKVLHLFIQKFAGFLKEQLTTQYQYQELAFISPKLQIRLLTLIHFFIGQPPKSEASLVHKT